MSGRLATRLESNRRRQFVGRREELGVFEKVLADPQAQVALVHVFGPGGVGKTSLLHEFVLRCIDDKVSHTVVDCRYLQASPEAFQIALQTSGGVPEKGKHVLFIDTFETLEPLEEWFRESFLPNLPDGVTTVMMGRRALSKSWRGDSAWRSLMKVIPLRNLSLAESKSYLDTQSVPEAKHDQIIAFTHGHPLALSLISYTFDHAGDINLEGAEMPSVVRILLDRFMEKIAEPIHRETLEVCAMARATTEALLAEVVSQDRAAELFAWLGDLSFIETGAQGLFPHDLAREAIAAELRWRNPDRHAQLHHKTRAYYSARLSRASEEALQSLLFDYIFLHRENPVVQPFFDWDSGTQAFVEQAKPQDILHLVEMVRTHEGEASASLAEHWLSVQTQNALVVRDSSAEHGVAGFMLALDVAPDPHDSEPTDPGVRAARAHLEANAPLRKGERCTMFRFWMDANAYQGVSAAQSLIFVNIVRHYLVTPNLAFSFLPCADPEFWGPVFGYASLKRLLSADYIVGGKGFGMHGHDWRALPFQAWLNLLSEREVPLGSADEAPKALHEVLVLSKEAFDQAVLDALKGFSNQAKLSRNPLINSRVIRELAGSSADTATCVRELQAALARCADELKGSSKDLKLYQALLMTYFKPERSQESAAERLDISIASFRRHLKTGVERLCELLWLQETRG